MKNCYNNANISKLVNIHSLDSVRRSVFTKSKKGFAIVRALQNLISELTHSVTKSGLPKLTAVSLLSIIIKRLFVSH
jgi:hypothetical protein